MKPSNEIIEKFQRIFFEEFGEEISTEEAYKKFLRLVNLLRVILRPSGIEKEEDLNATPRKEIDPHPGNFLK